MKQELRKQFDKYLIQVNPKNMIEFIDFYRKGELHAFSISGGESFSLGKDDESHIVSYINSGNYIFGRGKTRAGKEKRKVIINMDGGLIQSVINEAEFEIEIRDYDLEGIDDSERTIYTDDDGDQYIIIET